MSSLAMSSTVDQQIVLHQFTPRHSAQARAMLGWSQEDLARETGVAPQTIQRFERHADVNDETRLTLAFRLEAEGLVFFPGFAPGWGMNRPASSASQPAPGSARGFFSRLLGSTRASTGQTTPQPNGV
ncbi:helix-turn-helix transcriptional regulator [Pseudomonas mucidolens]|uniref:Helix-turn-helix n=1 Tax=Pseudomonas mucidolens TaxID=46679 RepID=A0A1H2LWA0_9PSED|nr:helix-turn-helix transcriptional regulator [Pseudomonas mucidolens]SDU85257.1 Helix-turn-helix [Pseudomonas mucidolens]SQH35137.1 XRE family transcriptional regulator [Pseudomonas mucidolens]